MSHKFHVKLILITDSLQDKERRFIEQVDAKAASLKSTYPTIFAWHGSPLFNWHSIVREGLHFKYIACGRAYGNGVYMAQDFHTSAGYSSYYGGMYGNQSNTVSFA
jgi:ubiquitin-conjugating enzyme E2 Q